METSPYVEFREVENTTGTDAEIQVFFFGVHVQTIRNIWTRPGGHVYCEKEQCIRRAQAAIRREWNMTEGRM